MDRMKRTNGKQGVPPENQKRRKVSQTLDKSDAEPPMSEHPDQATVSSNNPGRISSPAGPTIIVHRAEGTEDSLRSTEQESTPEPVTTSQQSKKPREPPPPRQESPKPVHSARRARNLAQGTVIQNTITCTLRTTLRGSLVSSLPRELEVVLHSPETYQEIEQEAEQHAKTLCAGSIGTTEMIFRYGNCTIIWDDISIYRRPLRSYEEWAEVYKSIVEYWTSHSQEHARLHIWRDYHQQPTIDGSFADTKNNEIHDLMKHAWGRKRYIAHSDLEKVMSDHTVREIIMQADCTGIEPHEKDMFIQQVQSKGRVLLAICLQSDIKMQCLKHLLDHKDSDVALPFDLKDLCHQSCRSKFQRLLNEQGSYLAARFDGPGQHKNLHPSIVVPLHFCPRANGRKNMNLEEVDSSVNELQDSYSEEFAAKEKTAAECGSGAYSNVYCVKLDPNHHGLSKDLDTCFALKEFRDRGQKSSEDFGRELKILEEIRLYDHSHIVTHLATWTQVGRHYLLFPFAQCNLREYMSQTRFKLSEKEDIIWLLHQVQGIAAAVKHIHHLSGPEPPAPSPTLVAPAVEQRKTAWHHDLKPENILFFLDSCAARGIFRISDWGSGKVNEYRRTSSIHTRHPIGTVTYEPPEAISEGSTSRPYDLWSLGCVYLELLIWAVFGPEAVDNFSDEREDDKRVSNFPTGTLRDDAFWGKVGNEYVLRSSVIAWMQILEKTLTEPSAPPFKELLECVRRMLEIEPANRIKATELSELLDQIYQTKKVELENARDSSTPGSWLSLIPTDHPSPDRTTYGLSDRSSGPAYAEHFNLSPSDMSPRTNRGQHSRNSSASEPIPSSATQSRQPSIASTLSVRERRGSHSSANSPIATKGGT